MAGRKVTWSNRAKIKMFAIFDFYTERNKSPAYAKKLYKRFRKELALLDAQPELGILTDEEEIRGLIVENFILFYEVNSTTIFVHTIWDCRQNPNDLRIL